MDIVLFPSSFLKSFFDMITITLTHTYRTSTNIPRLKPQQSSTKKALDLDNQGLLKS